MGKNFDEILSALRSDLAAIAGRLDELEKVIAALPAAPVAPVGNPPLGGDVPSADAPSPVPEVEEQDSAAVDIDVADLDVDFVEPVVETEPIVDFAPEGGDDAPPEGRATRGTEAGGPSPEGDGGVSPEDELPKEEHLPAPEAPVSTKPVVAVTNDGYRWETDLPGSQVKNVISAVSLNDRVLFINTLFKEDPLLFQHTIAEFNAMSSFEEAVEYVKQNYPDWNLSSEVVYRLMMAVRRKFI